MQNIVNRLDDMLLFQDVSINDVNEVVEKVGNILPKIITSFVYLCQF
jgi:p-aminobenzoyl-glutamate transporter AbgT